MQGGLLQSVFVFGESETAIACVPHATVHLKAWKGTTLRRHCEKCHRSLISATLIENVVSEDMDHSASHLDVADLACLLAIKDEGF